MIASNKQRQGHDNLTKIHREKLKGAIALQEPLVCKSLESQCNSNNNG